MAEFNLDRQMDEEEPKCKVIIVGEPKTGKTSLLNRMANRNTEINTEYIPTLQPNCYTIYGNLHCWDFPGGVLRDQYMVGMDAAIIVYDATDCSTTNQIPDWIRLIRTYNRDTPIFVCGNKIDMLDNISNRWSTYPIFYRRATSFIRRNRTVHHTFSVNNFSASVMYPFHCLREYFWEEEYMSPYEDENWLE